ncbi:MAG TPA: hypothetical protein VKZ76_06715 [Edaphocola sp.]|nr:hypothetical protein [Edaphocola sp.]
MGRQVSTTEVSALHDFCVKHFVTHYDVRLELVDHLATSIEAIWEQNPNLEFEHALKQVYAGYGKTGFRQLMREKEHAVEKAANKGILTALKALFSWPQIGLVITMLLVCYFFYGYYERGNALAPGIFIYVFSCIALILDLSINVKLYRWRKQLTQPLLTVQTYAGFYATYIINYVIISTLLKPLFSEQNESIFTANPLVFVWCALCCIGCILLSIAHYRYAKSMFQKAREHYPMAFK